MAQQSLARRFHAQPDTVTADRIYPLSHSTTAVFADGSTMTYGATRRDDGLLADTEPTFTDATKVIDEPAVADSPDSVKTVDQGVDA